MADWNNKYVRWYEYHREDYAAVKDRLSACRNVVLRGRKDAAKRILKLAALNAVMSIQTDRDRHETAFTAYCAGGISIESAMEQTVYYNHKTDWIKDAWANFDYSQVVDILRQESASDALEYVVENHKGLSYVKAGFTLAMSGIWEVACPDSRTRQELDIDGRIRTRSDYDDALTRISDAVPIDAPLFIKQWVIYDSFAGEHARHMPFFSEVFNGEKWR